MLKWSSLPASIFVSNNYPKTTIYRHKQVSSGQSGEYTNPKGEYYGCNCVACFPILPNEMVMPQLPLSRDKGQIQSEPKPKRQYQLKGVVSDAYFAPSVLHQNPHRSTWSKYYRSAKRVIPVFKTTGDSPRQGKSRTKRAILSYMAGLDNGYINLSFSAKTRPRLSGRPRPPRPIRPGRGSQDKPGRSTNKRPEPISNTPKYRLPKFTLTTHKYKPQNLSIQHFLWILKGCPIPFGRSVVHPFGKIGPTAATAFGGWGGPDRSTLFLSRKRVKKKPIGPNHCSFLLRSLQCTQMEAKFYSCVHYPKNLTYQTIRQPKIYLNKVNTNFIHHKNNIVIPITKPLQPFLSLKAFSQ